MEYSTILTKSFLINEYIKNKKSTYQIAKEVGCSQMTVWNYLKKYNIPMRTDSEAQQCKISKFSNILTKEFLIKEYIINKKSTHKIAKEIGSSDVNVLQYLIKYNIPRRTKEEGNRLINRKGKNNGNYKGIIRKCIDCGTKITASSILGRCRSCARIEEYKDPTNHPCYIDGSSFEPYPIAFNNFLKEQIRIRDNHQCQICGKLEKNLKGRIKKLSVHHIDYIKSNLDPENLITLCQKCHRKTNYNREIYIEYFSILKECIK